MSTYSARQKEYFKQKYHNDADFKRRQILRVQEWRKKNPEKYKIANRKYWLSGTNKEWRRKERLKVLTHYSNGTPKCSCCSEAILQFLTVDHVIPVSKSGVPRYSGRIKTHLIKNKFPPGFQVLCYNCNLGKRADLICPHRLAA
jgi:hypothetical protein